MSNKCELGVTESFNLTLSLTHCLSRNIKGHVRVGPETVVDPAYLVSRNMEDFVTWTDRSKIRRKVAAYNDKLDDFDLL